MSRATFRAEVVYVKLKLWRRLWYLLVGGIIAIKVARAPGRKSGAEILDTRVISSLQYRKLKRELKEKRARQRGP